MIHNGLKLCSIYSPFQKILSGSLQSLLASKEPELLLKAKSEVSLACTTSQSLSVELSTATLGGSGQQAPVSSCKDPGAPATLTISIKTSSLSDLQSSKKQSQSLDQLTPNQVAMWKSDVEEVILNKGAKGLGFSILDYQDPLNMADTVIVVRSLVPGGVAHVDGRLVPGDRIMYVNQVQLQRANLDTAVQALKGAPYGPVKIGISRPLTEDKMMMSQLRGRLTEGSTVSTTSYSTTSHNEEVR